MVEIFTMKSDDSIGRMVWPRNISSANSELNEYDVQKVKSEAQLLGIFYVEQRLEGAFEGYYISSKNTETDDQLKNFSESISLEPGEAQTNKGYGKIASRVIQTNPGKDVKVIIY